MNTILRQICEKFIGEVTEIFGQDKVLALDVLSLLAKMYCARILMKMS